MIRWLTLRWPRWLGPMPGRREAHAISWMALAAGVILCGVSVVLGWRGLPFLGRPLGGDFVEFYAVGKICNTYPSARIYDLGLLVGLQHQILPSMSRTQMLVFGQSPYIAWLFRPFALLPYAWAYVAWLGFSAALYVAGLTALFSAAGLTGPDRKTGYLLALSWAPFLFETWIGGQMAVVIFFLWAAAFLLFKNERPFLAGLALSLCLFKPNLVALPALMLLANRRWRAVAGLTLGGGMLGLISLATVGLSGLRTWAGILSLDAKFAAQTADAWHLAKYVDLTAFLHLLLGGGHTATALTAATALVVVLVLGRAWRRSGRGLNNELWAATLCFTLVVSAYTPIYDMLLAVAAGALTAGHGPSQERGQAFRCWLLLLYMTPWLTQSFAQFVHIQLITLVLAGFGVWTLALEWKRDPGKPETASPNVWQDHRTIPRPIEPSVAGRFWAGSRG